MILKNNKHLLNQIILFLLNTSHDLFVLKLQLINEKTIDKIIASNTTVIVCITINITIIIKKNTNLYLSHQKQDQDHKKSHPFQS
jgi:hypothetical protein